MSSWPTPPPSTAPKARPPAPATWSSASTPAPPSAYVAMTRGREDNVAHLVADDVARRPTAVGRRLRPGPGRPRTQPSPPNGPARTSTGTAPRHRPAGSRTCWPSCGPPGPNQADLTDHHQRLVAERDALQQVAAIRDRFAPAQQRLHTEQATAEKTWRNAQDRVAPPRHHPEEGDDRPPHPAHGALAPGAVAGPAGSRCG